MAFVAVHARQARVCRMPLDLEERVSWSGGGRVIDLVCILFTTLMVLLVVFQALRLDRELPWFRPIGAPDALARDLPSQDSGYDATVRPIPHEPPMLRPKQSWRKTSEVQGAGAGKGAQKGWAERAVQPNRARSWRG